MPMPTTTSPIICTKLIKVTKMNCCIKHYNTQALHTDEKHITVGIVVFSVRISDRSDQMPQQQIIL